MTKKGGISVMRMRASGRRILSGFLVAGAAAALVAVGGGPAMAADVPIWNGYGWAASAERAIEKAIDDVEIMASSEGLFECELIAAPLVWERLNTNGTVRFEASVDMICT